MFKFIKSLFKSDPAQKLIKERDKKYRLAVECQRNGNLRGYANLINEISMLELRIEDLVKQASEEDEKDNRIDTGSTDVVDYDGMGNQGRFPSKLNKKDRS